MRPKNGRQTVAAPRTTVSARRGIQPSLQVFNAAVIAGKLERDTMAATHWTRSGETQPPIHMYLIRRYFSALFTLFYPRVSNLQHKTNITRAFNVSLHSARSTTQTQHAHKYAVAYSVGGSAKIKPWRWRGISFASISNGIALRSENQGRHLVCPRDRPERSDDRRPSATLLKNTYKTILRNEKTIKKSLEYTIQRSWFYHGPKT